jgi:4-carboxymuconolactone decarboxylase
MTAESRTDAERYEQGLALFRTVNGDAGGDLVSSLADVAPALARHVVAHGFGDVYARPQLEAAQRQLVTLGVLTALGGCEPQLKVHVAAALTVGLSPTEIVEVFVHAAVYAGYPRALNAVAAAREVFAERGLLPLAGAVD